MYWYSYCYFAYETKYFDLKSTTHLLICIKKLILFSVSIERMGVSVSVNG